MTYKSRIEPLCAQKKRNPYRSAPRSPLSLPVLLANRYQIRNAPSPSGICDFKPTSEPAARTTFAATSRDFINQFYDGGVTRPPNPQLEQLSQLIRATSLTSSTTEAFMGPANCPPLICGREEGSSLQESTAVSLSVLVLYYSAVVEVHER